MAQQIINHGATVGDKTGETVFASFKKAKENFAELYTKDALGTPITSVVYTSGDITQYVQGGVTYSITYLNGRVNTISDGVTTRTVTYNSNGTVAGYS